MELNQVEMLGTTRPSADMEHLDLSTRISQQNLPRLRCDASAESRLATDSALDLSELLGDFAGATCCIGENEEANVAPSGHWVAQSISPWQACWRFFV